MYYFHCFGAWSAGGLLVYEGIILTLVSVSALTWYIRYLRFYYFHCFGAWSAWWIISIWRYHPYISQFFSALTWYIRYLRLYYYHCVGTSAGGLLVYDGIIRTLVSVSEQTWYIRYIYYWNVQFFYIVIIIKYKVLPQS